MSHALQKKNKTILIANYLNLNHFHEMFQQQPKRKLK